MHDIFPASVVAKLYPWSEREVQPGDMFSDPWIAFTNMEEAKAIGEEAIFKLGFEDPLREQCPYDQWVSLCFHPEDKGLVFLVPWLGNQEEIPSDDEGVLPLPFEAEFVFDEIWLQCKNCEDCGPGKAWLLMGHGVWREVKDIDRTTRFSHLSPESLIGAKKFRLDNLRGS